jgi:hypothetical protein
VELAQIETKMQIQEVVTALVVVVLEIITIMLIHLKLAVLELKALSTY